MATFPVIAEGIRDPLHRFQRMNRDLKVYALLCQNGSTHANDEVNRVA
jgi:hypothetical protein